MFPVLFTIPRLAGWLAHWFEALGDKEQRIARPRQVYLGPPVTPYTPLAERPVEPSKSSVDLSSYSITFAKRRQMPKPATAF
jgi:citrate synthase